MQPSIRFWRTAGIAIGLLVMAGGLWLLFIGGVAPALVFTLEGLVVVIGVVFERATYKAIEPKTPGAGWSRTPERFIDDASGKRVTVYVQTATGERKYVNE
jgi:hypothetical protein